MSFVARSVDEARRKKTNHVHAKNAMLPIASHSPSCPNQACDREPRSGELETLPKSAVVSLPTLSSTNISHACEMMRTTKHPSGRAAKPSRLATYGD
jgi:hypothetical protein